MMYIYFIFDKIYSNSLYKIIIGKMNTDFYWNKNVIIWYHLPLYYSNYTA